MHFHLPKPLHGWRDFAKEVGIIVVGVLIALGAEQLVQRWHWQEEAHQTRQALMSEIEYSALFATERVAVQKCLRDRIAQLATKLDSGSSGWTADPIRLGKARRPIGAPVVEPSIPEAYHAPHRPWLSDEWETAKSTAILNHFDRSEVRNFEFMFRSINQLRSLQDEEASSVPDLSFLSFDQQLEPQTRVRALTALAHLDNVNGLEEVMAQQILSSIRSRHVQLGPIAIGNSTVAFDAASKQILAALRDRYGTCVADVPLAT